MISIDEAETLAIGLISYLVDKPDIFQRICSATGLGAESLPKIVKSRSGLAGLLEHVCSDESLMLDFCHACDIPHIMPMQALAVLQHAPDTGAA